MVIALNQWGVKVEKEVLVHTVTTLHIYDRHKLKVETMLFGDK